MGTLRTFGRVVYRLLAIGIISYLLGGLVAGLAAALAAACFGDFDRALEELPKTRYFAPAVLGYLAAVTGAVFGGVTSGLAHLGEPPGAFRIAVYWVLLPMSVLSALVAALVGIALGLWTGPVVLWAPSPWWALGSGALCGVAVPLAGRYLARMLRRGPHSV